MSMSLLPLPRRGLWDTGNRQCGGSPARSQGPGGRLLLLVLRLAGAWDVNSQAHVGAMGLGDWLVAGFAGESRQEGQRARKPSEYITPC